MGVCWIALLSLVAGCTTVSPSASSVPGTAAPSAAASAPSSSVVLNLSPEPSTGPAQSLPAASSAPTPGSTPAPTPATPAPKPSKGPKPSGPAMPNLVVTKVALGADPWLINTDTPLAVTVKNDGSAAAARFYVSAEADSADGLHFDQLSAVSVDSLAAGASTQVAVNANVADAGDYTITATADPYDDIAESNENDNTKQIKATAVDLPNLLPTDLSGGPDNMVADSYVFEYTISNTGSAAADNFSVLTFDYAPDGTMDTIDHFVVTTPLAPGDHLLENYDVNATQSGTYRVYTSIDSDNTVTESNETDNEAEMGVTMP